MFVGLTAMEWRTLSAPLRCSRVVGSSLFGLSDGGCREVRVVGRQAQPGEGVPHGGHMVALSSLLTPFSSFFDHCYPCYSIQPSLVFALAPGLVRTYGLSAVTTTVALVLLYIVVAGFFAALLIIADRIRHAGDSVCSGFCPAAFFPRRFLSRCCRDNLRGGRPRLRSIMQLVDVRPASVRWSE